MHPTVPRHCSSPACCASGVSTSCAASKLPASCASGLASGPSSEGTAPRMPDRSRRRHDRTTIPRPTAGRLSRRRLELPFSFKLAPSTGWRRMIAGRTRRSSERNRCAFRASRCGGFPEALTADGRGDRNHRASVLARRLQLAHVAEGLARRTPGPLPSSGMNSIPALSRARRIAASVLRKGVRAPRSKSTSVRSLTSASPANSARERFRRARAARHCPGSMAISCNIADFMLT